LEDEKYKHRYYSEKKYEAAKGTIVLGLIFVFVGILSLVFRALDIRFVGLLSWGFWLFIPAFFILLGGFQQLYTNEKYKKAVMRALMDRGNQGTYKLEHIALEVGIRPKDLIRILADLRDKGKVIYRFNPETGEIELGQKIVYVQSEQYTPPARNLNAPLPSEGKNFCVYCGYQLERDAKFCPSCGSKLK
jgi:hypothetical protein